MSSKDKSPKESNKGKIKQPKLFLAGICFGGKARLYLVAEKVKVNQGSAAEAHRGLQLFVAEWLRLSARQCSRTFRESLFRVYQEWRVAAKLIRPQPIRLPPLGRNAWEVQRLLAQADQQGWTEGSARGDLGRIAVRLAWPSCTGIPEEAIEHIFK